MTKKLFLTSVLTMCMIAPAIAEPAQPGDEVTAQSMCVIEDIGVSSGTAQMEAIWTVLKYSEPAGQYLEYDSVNDEINQHQTCLQNSYCPGFTNEDFTDSNMGIYSCNDLDSGAYPYSAAGADTSDKCYNTSTVSCATRNPLTVANGVVTYTNETTTTKNYKGYGVVMDDALACNATVTCNTGYTASARGALADYVGVRTMGDTSHVRYRSHDDQHNYGSQTGLGTGGWEVTFPDGTKVSGVASCNTSAGTTTGVWGYDNTLQEYTYTSIGENTQASGSYNTNSSGQYCWCNMTGYTPNGGNATSTNDAVWVFNNTRTDANDCLANCAEICAGGVQGTAGFRKAVFGTYGNFETCDANTIRLEWYNLGNLHETNQCTYDGSITLPTEPAQRAGYEFHGWKLMED